VLYSVGVDGVDDGGSEAPTPDAYGEIDEWRRLDRVFYLSDRRREYMYIARRLSCDMAMPGVANPEPIPPWERDARAAAPATTQPTSR
jgi:hypothetical protein